MISHIKYIFFIILSTAILTTGCDDEPFPTGFEGDVVFRVDGTLDDNGLYLEAGKEDFYMYTDVELQEDIIRFSGSFQKNDLCEAPCSEQLKIIIHNYKFGTDFNIDSALYVGDYSLEPEITLGSSGYQVDFLATPEGNGPFTYNWILDDTGAISTSQNPTHIYTDLNDTVFLSMQDASGCSAFYFDKLSTLPSNNCELDFTYTVFQDSIQNTTYDFEVNPKLHADTFYSWNITSLNTPQTFSFSATSQFNFTATPFNNPFPAEVCLIQNTPSCTSTICKTIDNNNSCGVKFTYNTTDLTAPSDTSIFSMVIIEYTMPDGQFYSSELGSQTGSTFEILNLADYLQNERDQSTKSIEAAVDCKLYNTTGEFLNFTTNELIFSVSIPN